MPDDTPNGLLFSDPAWQRAKKAFPKSNRSAQSQHAKLQRIHGAMPGQTCGGCKHLSGEPGDRYFKCQKSTITSSPATDWRKKFEACGLFENRGE